MTGTETELERRVAVSQLRLVDVDADQRLSTIEGRAVPYGVWTNVGWYLENMAPGVFDKSTGEKARGLPLLLWHDNRSWPIGVSTQWRSDDGGLDGVWRLDESGEAQRAARMAKDGMLTGMSVGFMPIRSDWQFVEFDEWDPDLGEEHMDRCTRLEGRLAEVSIVPAGAYEDAQVSLVRSAERNPHRTATPRLDAWRRIAEQLHEGAQSQT